MKFICIFLFSVLIIFAYTSCKQRPEKPPIAQDKMSKILLDMQLAETYSQGLGDSSKSRFEKNYDSLSGFYTSILKHYKLSFKEFNEALDWYKERPAMIDTLYASVLTDFMEAKAKANVKNEEGGAVKIPATKAPINTTSSTAPIFKKDTVMHILKISADSLKKKMK